MHLIANEGGNHHQEAGQLEDCTLQQQHAIVIEFTFSLELINEHEAKEKFTGSRNISKRLQNQSGKLIGKTFRYEFCPRIRDIPNS